MCWLLVKKKAFIITHLCIFQRSQNNSLCSAHRTGCTDRRNCCLFHNHSDPDRSPASLRINHTDWYLNDNPICNCINRLWWYYSRKKTILLLYPWWNRVTQSARTAMTFILAQLQTENKVNSLLSWSPFYSEVHVTDPSTRFNPAHVNHFNMIMSHRYMCRHMLHLNFLFFIMVMSYSKLLMIHICRTGPLNYIFFKSTNFLSISSLWVWTPV